MPRRPRKFLGDGTYHVTARGVARTETFKDAHDYRRFLRLFAEVVEGFEWHCHAFCLMPNHYHLVMAAVQPRLSWGLQRLNGMYAQRFNRRHERWGHLFGDRFEARLIESERYLRHACRYVENNPVRARLCDDPRDWPWSSAAMSRW
jgi:putative transposase